MLLLKTNQIKWIELLAFVKCKLQLQLLLLLLLLLLYIK